MPSESFRVFQPIFAHCKLLQTLASTRGQQTAQLTQEKVAELLRVPSCTRCIVGILMISMYFVFVAVVVW
jgi:cell division protein FtsX